MKFEVDLIRYVIDLAIARRCFVRSKDLNADWLPFHTILDVFSHVCSKLRLAKEVETRCYKALLKMSATHERHLTWANKVQNISKYLPTSTSTHSASHTSSSWTRQRIAHGQTSHALSNDTPPSNRKAALYHDFHGYGLNLGRLRERGGPPAGVFAWQKGSPHSQYHSDNNTLRRIMREIYDEEQATTHALEGPAPDRTPPPYSTYRSPSTGHHETPLNTNTAANSAEYTEPPSTPYYKHYVPTARWAAQGIPISPITPGVSGSPATATTTAASTAAVTPPPPPASFTELLTSMYRTPLAAASTTAASAITPGSSRVNTNGGPFADAELRAMHQRVAAIEAEARRTRALLASIAHLQETSLGVRLDDDDHHRYPEREEEEQEGVEERVGGRNTVSAAGKATERYASHSKHYHHEVEYGEIPLSPYLQSVLHLPPAILSASHGKAATAAKELHGSPHSGAIAHNQSRASRFTCEVSSPEPASLQMSPSASTGARRHNVSDTPRSSQRASPHSSAERAPPTLLSSGSSGVGAVYSPPGTSREPAASTPPSARSSSSAGRDSQARARPQSPSSHRADYSSSLHCSAAMRKYLELTSHRTAGVLEAPPHATLLSGPLKSPPSTHTATKGGHSPSSSSRQHARLSTEDYRYDCVSPSFYARASKEHSPLSQTQAQGYRNTCRTIHAVDAEVTTIDSKLDEVLGDSLNIEEKDGKVYVHFQSKFLLE